MSHNPNSYELARRDGALAAFLGIDSGAHGDFGSEFGGIDYDNPYGYDPYAGEFGAFGSFGYNPYGADAPPAPAAHHAAMTRPHPAHVAAVFQEHARKSAISKARVRLIDPNEGSETKIERYSFSVNQVITLGTAVAISMTNNPTTNIRPQRAVFNAPSVGFVTLSAILVGNVNGLVGGIEDAASYGPNAQNVVLDLPTMSPAMRLTVSGSYAGYIPPGFANAFSFPFIGTFQGPASMVA